MWQTLQKLVDDHTYEALRVGPAPIQPIPRISNCHQCGGTAVTILATEITVCVGCGLVGEMDSGDSRSWRKADLQEIIQAVNILNDLKDESYVSSEL